MVVLAFGVGAIALPASYPLVDRLALVAFGLALAYGLHRIASVRVEADERGLRVVNLVYGRRLEWTEVLGVRLGRDDPWLVLDLSDGTALPAMGVQGSDGAHAREQARALARLVAGQSRTDRND